MFTKDRCMTSIRSFVAIIVLCFFVSTLCGGAYAYPHMSNATYTTPFSFGDIVLEDEDLDIDVSKIDTFKHPSAYFQYGRWDSSIVIEQIYVMDYELQNIKNMFQNSVSQIFEPQGTSLISGESFSKFSKEDLKEESIATLLELWFKLAGVQGGTNEEKSETASKIARLIVANLQKSKKHYFQVSDILDAAPNILESDPDVVKALKKLSRLEKRRKKEFKETTVHVLSIGINKTIYKKYISCGFYVSYLFNMATGRDFEKLAEELAEDLHFYAGRTTPLRKKNSSTATVMAWFFGIHKLELVPTVKFVAPLHSNFAIVGQLGAGYSFNMIAIPDVFYRFFDPSFSIATSSSFVGSWAIGIEYYPTEWFGVSVNLQQKYYFPETITTEKISKHEDGSKSISTITTTFSCEKPVLTFGIHSIF